MLNIGRLAIAWVACVFAFIFVTIIVVFDVWLLLLGQVSVVTDVADMKVETDGKGASPEYVEHSDASLGRFLLEKALWAARAAEHQGLLTRKYGVLVDTPPSAPLASEKQQVGSVFHLRKAI